ncbi:MAG: hypothetical protein H6710_23910 [Myxococcales bacterium]|nr:hypothetical protein [Myxococcales bacterium]
MSPRNHFISVSRAGALIARRVGEAPVAIADVEAGLWVSPPPGRGSPAPFRVFFERRPGAPRRSVWVTAIAAADTSERVDVDAFLAAHAITEEELGAWMRAAVDEALEQAARSPAE